MDLELKSWTIVEQDFEDNNELKGVKMSSSSFEQLELFPKV